MEGAGAAVDELLDELGDIGAGSPLGRQVTDLLLGGDLAGQQEPEETLGQGLSTAGSLGQELLDLGDLMPNGLAMRTESACRELITYGTATETDTLLGVKDGTLQEKKLSVWFGFFAIVRTRVRRTIF